MKPFLSWRGGTGRRAGLKNQSPKGGAGSIPAASTNGDMKQIGCATAEKAKRLKLSGNCLKSEK